MPGDELPSGSHCPHPFDEASGEELHDKRKATISDEPVDGDEVQPRLGTYQLSLFGLFVLTTVCAAYVFVEKIHTGHFGLFIVGGMALVVVFVLPALWFLAWLVRTVWDGGGFLTMVLATVGLAGVVIIVLLRYSGM